MESSPANINVVDIPPPILAWWQLEDTHVRHGQSTASTLARDSDESQVRDKGAQHTHRYREEANKDRVDVGRLRRLGGSMVYGVTCVLILPAAVLEVFEADLLSYLLDTLRLVCNWEAASTAYGWLLPHDCALYWRWVHAFWIAMHDDLQSSHILT